MEMIKKLFYPVKLFFNFMRDYFKVVVFLFIAFLILTPSQKSEDDPAKDIAVMLGLKPPPPPRDYNLVEISLDGAILSSDEFISRLDRFDTNQTKGILISIDSPGGSVPSSVEMSLALKKISEKIPTVVYAKGLMASGSYYAGVWADKIVANPGGYVGSIGVLFQGADISELLHKIGVEPQVLKSGKYKEAGMFYKEWSEDEKRELQHLIDSTYEDFITTVAEARGLNVDGAKNYAEGRIFTAKDAQRLGLVDSLGIIYDAKKELEAISGVSNPRWYKYEEPKENFLNSLSNSVSKGVQNALSGAVR
ncbi:MAG: signal peptide peptidase SppA [Campylobacterales bacterium]